MRGAATATRIEGLFLGIARALVDGAPCKLLFPEDDVGSAPISIDNQTTALSVALTLNIAADAYESVLGERSTSLRQLYYDYKTGDLPRLFRSPAQVSRSVSTLCRLLETPRFDLKIGSSARGHIAGCVKIRSSTENHWLDLSTIDSAPISESLYAAVISGSQNAIETQRGCPVIVVEKDAVFQSLVQSKLWKTFPCILVTGCGVPDFPTRAVTAHLGRTGHDIFGFFDFNPSGFMIYAIYTFGTRGGRSQGLQDSALASPRMKLAGLLARDAAMAEEIHRQSFSTRDQILLENLVTRFRAAGETALIRELHSMGDLNYIVELNTPVRILSLHGSELILQGARV